MLNATKEKKYQPIELSGEEAVKISGKIKKNDSITWERKLTGDQNIPPEKMTTHSLKKREYKIRLEYSAEFSDLRVEVFRDLQTFFSQHSYYGYFERIDYPPTYGFFILTDRQIFRGPQLIAREFFDYLNQKSENPKKMSQRKRRRGDLVSKLIDKL